MARWLAPRLPGSQHWVLHDRDRELLSLVPAQPPGPAADGSPVTVTAREHDVTRLRPDDLADASLVTASALLDMLTAAEVERFVAACARPGCPVLVTLSVTGQVTLDPPDPLDEALSEAFNTHQRRRSADGPRLGPDAVGMAADAWHSRGREVLRRDSPWRLGGDNPALLQAWFTGWLGAALEQAPHLAAQARGYAQTRRRQAAAGVLSALVMHEDLLVRPG
jgi:hypothetical protein